MKKIKNSHLSLCFVVIFVMLFSTVSIAQGTTSINISSNAIGVGGTASVTVQASNGGKMTVKYTASLMELVDCSAEGYTSDGNIIEFDATEATITFMGTGEGTASIIVSAENCAGSSATVSIGGEAGTETSAEGGETPVEDPSVISDAPSAGVTGTVNDDGGFDINGVKYVVSERFSDSQILDGFEKHVINIGTHTYNELSNGSIILVYLKPADNTAGDGVFYVYDEGAGTVVPFNYVGSKKDFVLIGSAPGAVSTALIPTTMTVDSGTYSVYTVTGSEFFYFYGTDKNGTQNWFAYDSANNSVSRADLALIALAESQEYHITDSSNDGSQSADIDNDDSSSSYTGIENYQKKLAKFRIAVSVLIVLCVILVFVVANLLLGRRGEDEDPFAGEIVNKPAKRQRSIVFKDNKEDSFDDEEETTEEGFAESDLDANDNVENNDNDFLIDFNDL